MEYYESKGPCHTLFSKYSLICVVHLYCLFLVFGSVFFLPLLIIDYVTVWLCDWWLAGLKHEGHPVCTGMGTSRAPGQAPFQGISSQHTGWLFLRVERSRSVPGHMELAYSCPRSAWCRVSMVMNLMISDTGLQCSFWWLAVVFCVLDLILLYLPVYTLDYCYITLNKIRFSLLSSFLVDSFIKHDMNGRGHCQSLPSICNQVDIFCLVSPPWIHEYTSVTLVPSIAVLNLCQYWEKGWFSDFENDQIVY